MLECFSRQEGFWRPGEYGFWPCSRRRISDALSSAYLGFSRGIHGYLISNVLYSPAAFEPAVLGTAQSRRKY